MSMPNPCATVLERCQCRHYSRPLFSLLVALHLGHAIAGEMPADCLREVTGETPDATPLKQWLDREGACGSHAAYLYRLGQLLNAAHRYPEALDRLEGAMLRAPDDWRTQLEYVIALAGSGDEIAARSLLKQLRAHAEIDAATRREIETILEGRWLRSLLPRGTVGLVVGYDDNLLGNARQGPFDLTLPYGRLAVTPGADQKPLPGSFIRADARLDGGIRYGDDERLLHYGLFGSWRWTPGQPAERTHWGMVLEKNNIQFPGLYVQTSYQQLVLESKDIYRQAQIGAGQSFAGIFNLPTCGHRAGIELQARQYPQIRALDGTYAGLQLQSSCAWMGLQVQFRHGRDTPRDDARPGGKQDQTAIKLAGQGAFLRGILLADAEFSWQRDASGYSPLLENNRRRALHRTIYRVEYRWPKSGWQPYASLEWLDQKANLPLFSLRNTILSLGANIVW